MIINPQTPHTAVGALKSGAGRQPFFFKSLFFNPQEEWTPRLEVEVVSVEVVDLGIRNWIGDAGDRLSGLLEEKNG